jgi:peptidoglycan/LPS O-acetylase OafA/YrhL
LGPSGNHYRPALDGIRAIAVLSVVAYHLPLPWMRGGFLGVDIFFVLSGYLITSLLLAEHAASGRISLTQFWTRRARRLFPALLLMIAVVALGVRTLRPITEWPTRSADLMWTLLYGANWHQVITSQDYFARYSGISPLRHMWSIAIEEQFYLVWPLIVAVMLAGRGRRWFLPGIVVAAVASAMAMFLLYDPANPTRAYVGTDARAQELLAGAALAVMMLMPLGVGLARGVSSTRDRAGMWMVGLCVSGLTLALVAGSDASPLYYKGGALAVAVAVAVIVLSVETAPRSVLARALSWGPLAWVGRISYGLYLWHWPVIVFTPALLVLVLGGRRGLTIIEHRPSLNAVVIALTLFCTVLSYYILERPIRYGGLSRFLTARRVAVAGTAAAFGVFLAVGSLLALPPGVLAQVTQEDVACEQKACEVVDAGAGRPLMAVLGDSVPKSMIPAFAQVARNHAWSLVTAAHNGHTVVERRLDHAEWQTISDRIAPVRQAVLAFAPDVIIVSDNWLPVPSFDDAGIRMTRGSSAHIADTEPRVGRLVEQLTSTGAMVVLMRLTHESRLMKCDDARIEAEDVSKGMVPAAGERSPSPDCPRFEPYNAMLDRVAGRYPDRVRVIDLGDVLCPNEQCAVNVDGIIVRYDGLHFSAEGARWLAPHLERKLIAAGIRLDL